jgi:alpha-tubulin suppressor-like RCC1 family protein
MACPDITTIDKTECIGNSLIKINNNFNELKTSICNLDAGVSIQNNGTQLGADIQVLNFTGGGISPIVSNDIAIINVPGNDIRKVVGLEEQGVNSGGGKNNFFILDDGSLRSCGANDFGELGTGVSGTSVSDRRTFFPRIAGFRPPLELDEKITKIYTQSACTYVITNKGRLYGAGYNAEGQIGQGNTRTSYPVFTFINVLGDATALNPVTNPVPGYQAATGDPIVGLATGSSAIYTNITLFALTSSGNLFTWGRNIYGQAGVSTASTGNTITSPVGTFSGNVRYITSSGAADQTTAYAVTKDDKLFVVGRNARGQAGISSSSLDNIPSWRPVIGLPANYRVNNIRTGGVPLGAGTSTAEIVTTFVTLKDGSLYACGSNINGAVIGQGFPLPTQNEVVQFTRVSGFTDAEYVEDVACHVDDLGITCWALIRNITADGSPGYRLKCWGDNTSGQLGLNTRTRSEAVTENPNWPWLFDGAKVLQVVVGGNGTEKTTLVLDNKYRLWAAGYAQSGLIGNGEDYADNGLATIPIFTRVLFNPALGTPIQIRSTNNDSIQNFAVGTTTINLPTTNFLCLLNTGKVLGWGCDSDQSGQLGVDPQPDPVSVPALVQIIL